MSSTAKSRSQEATDSGPKKGSGKSDEEINSPEEGAGTKDNGEDQASEQSPDEADSGGSAQGPGGTTWPIMFEDVSNGGIHEAYCGPVTRMIFGILGTLYVNLMEMAINLRGVSTALTVDGNVVSRTQQLKSSYQITKKDYVYSEENIRKKEELVIGDRITTRIGNDTIIRKGGDKTSVNEDDVIDKYVNRLVNGQYFAHVAGPKTKSSEDVSDGPVGVFEIASLTDAERLDRTLTDPGGTRSPTIKLYTGEASSGTVDPGKVHSAAYLDKTGIDLVAQSEAGPDTAQLRMATEGSDKGLGLFFKGEEGQSTVFLDSKSVEITSKEQIVLRVGDSQITVSADGISIDAKKVTFNKPKGGATTEHALRKIEEESIQGRKVIAKPGAGDDGIS